MVDEGYNRGELLGAIGDVPLMHHAQVMIMDDSAATTTCHRRVRLAVATEDASQVTCEYCIHALAYDARQALKER